jgi:tryptophan synthase alpha chain
VSRRSEQRFSELAGQGRKALIPFITAGDPNPEWTVDIMHALVEGGASLLELGVPFSDPTADGPVIQAASERAIARGVSLPGVLDMVTEFRKRDQDTPVILMGYMNPVIRFGAGRLAEAAAAAGIDGFLLVDCPPEEDSELQASLAARDIDCIRMVAPTTTTERLDSICPTARGFIYYVSFKGITGADRLDAAAIAAPIAAIRERTELPVAAGFGITGPASAAATAQFADAVVIGSALVRLLAEAGSRAEAATVARDFVASVHESLENSRQ